MPEPPGLAEERTDLAWTRSGIALLGAFAILVRRVWSGSPTTVDLAALALLGVAGFGWAVASSVGDSRTTDATKHSRAARVSCSPSRSERWPSRVPVSS